MGRCGGNCQHFGVGRNVFEAFCLVVSLANYFIVASNNGANWNLVFFKCHLCLVERFAHKQFVVIEYIHAANLSMPGHKCNIKRIRLLVFIIRGVLFINLALNAVNNL